MRVTADSAIGVRRISAVQLLDRSYSLRYLIFLCVVLMFGVLAFGAVEIWSSSILEVCAALLFTVLVVHKVCSSRVQVRWNPLYPPMLGFAAVAAVQLVFNLTAYRYETLVVCLQFFAYGMLLFVISQIMGDERSCKILVLAFSIFGSAVALFAYLQPGVLDAGGSDVPNAAGRLSYPIGYWNGAAALLAGAAILLAYGGVRAPTKTARQLPITRQCFSRSRPGCEPSPGSCLGLAVR